MVKVIVNLFYKPVSELVQLLNSNQIFVPVNGGSSLRNVETGIERLFFDDDFAENISAHNIRLNEMTSIWWAWKNLERVGNPDYVGFNHYRRFFDTDRIQNNGSFDIFVAKPIRCPYTLMWQYQYYHSASDLDTCIGVLDFVHPGDGSDFKRYLETHTDNFAPMNMFVMRRELFEEWCEYIFPVLFSLENIIDVSGRDNYQKRAVCFLCERIFGWWAFEKAKTLSVEQLDVIERLEFKDNRLNERGTY